MTQTRAITLNALSLYAVALVLAAAFSAQLLLHELPCPLCLLQRILFAMLAIGPILNIRFGPRPSHYALSLLAAVAGAVASTRQVLLHIMPGDAGYGSALLGYHYYTWALIGFIAAIVLLAAVLLFDRQVRGRRRRIAADRRPVRAGRRLARDRADVAQRDLDAARMRFRRLRRQSDRLRIAQALLRPLRNVQAALDGGPRQAAFQPTRHMLEAIESNQFARAIEADQIAHPAEHGNIGNGIFIIHHPLAAAQMYLQHAEQAL